MDNSAAGRPVFELSDFAARYADEPALAREILGLFLDQTPPLVEAAAVAIAARDEASLRDLAHKLKGRAGAIGAPRVTALAASFMETAGSADASALEALFAELNAELATLEIALREYLHSIEGK